MSSELLTFGSPRAAKEMKIRAHFDRNVCASKLVPAMIITKKTGYGSVNVRPDDACRESEGQPASRTQRLAWSVIGKFKREQIDLPNLYFDCLNASAQKNGEFDRHTTTTTTTNWNGPSIHQLISWKRRQVHGHVRAA